jgi:hypothetical protein
LERQHGQIAAADSAGSPPAETRFAARRAEVAQPKTLGAAKTSSTIRAKLPEALVPVTPAVRVYDPRRPQA